MLQALPGPPFCACTEGEGGAGCSPGGSASLEAPPSPQSPSLPSKHVSTEAPPSLEAPSSPRSPPSKPVPPSKPLPPREASPPLEAPSSRQSSSLPVDCLVRPAPISLFSVIFPQAIAVVFAKRLLCVPWPFSVSNSSADGMWAGLLSLVWHVFPAGVCEPRTRGVSPDPDAGVSPDPVG